jgi:hypothetical protein
MVLLAVNVIFAVSLNVVYALFVVRDAVMALCHAAQPLM